MSIRLTDCDILSEMTMLKHGGVVFVIGMCNRNHKYKTKYQCMKYHDRADDQIVSMTAKLAAERVNHYELHVLLLKEKAGKKWTNKQMKN